MKLKKLIAGLDVQVKGSKEIEISGLSADSRKIAPQNLFFVKKGRNFDGSEFISHAMNAGAVCIATDIYDPFFSGSQIICSDIQSLEVELAARFYQHPSKELFVVGVTGTKGKTSSSYLIKHVLDHLQTPSGLIGTVETIVKNTHFPSSLTTHDPIYNQKWLKEMVFQGLKGAVIEVSSHGLDQNRVKEIDFDLGVFTNLSPDHLDYHGSMEAYIAAKQKLFHLSKRGIFNADNPYSNQMGKGLSFGIEKGDIRAKDLLFKANGTYFTIDQTRFFSPLIGRFNVYNMLAAIAVGIELKASLEELKNIVKKAPQPPARMQRVKNVFIDFAHSGEALENALKTLSDMKKGKVIVVFGCGGERDPLRRSSMAKAAEEFADLSIITTDNPRREDPLAIIEEIVSHFKKSPFVETDRKLAIEKAIALAGPDDLVLIAGKGHEKVQIFADCTVPFDDVEIVKGALKLSH